MYSLEVYMFYDEDKKMFYFTLTCYVCKKAYKAYEGSPSYQLAKKNRTKTYCCEDCNNKIRYEAIKNFFR